MKATITSIIILALIGVFFVFKSQFKTTPTPSTPQTATSQTPVTKNTVTLTQDGFSPSSLTIKAGETVTWINKSGSEATVNSDPHPTHTDYPPLNLGSFTDGQSLTLTFDKPGTYGYHDHLEPNLRGSIIVQ